ncbi:MAG TPA: fibronectin/fibrinogen-binding protein [Anaerolineae bacterium]|nr:fibronectin/fibrinogen-binding protein [Anaerolineae bacterium]
MYFDALTMAAVADELREKILGGRVQKVLLPAPLSLGLEIYAHRERHYLLASAHTQAARVHLAGTKLRRGVETPTPLLLLLRKYARGARIDRLEQPPFERVLHIGLDHHEHGCTTLVVEVMGRHSNIVLVDAGSIVMECVKRIGPEMSRYRTILPGQPYLPPPPQEKLAPSDLTELRLRYIVEAQPPDVPLWQRLVQGLKGVSPLLAQEIVYRATGRTDTLAGEVEKMSPLLAAIGDLLSPLENGHWQPSVVREKGEIAVFAPYQLTHREGHELLASISQAVEGYYADAVREEPHGFLKQSLRRAIARGRERQQKKRRALERSLAARGETEALRQKGELILAYATQIAPGQTELVIELEPGQPSLTIALDPRSSPVENAQMYFRAYRKAKAGAEEIPALLEQVDLELRYLDQLETDLELASTQPEVQEVRAALSEAGYLKGERRRRKPPRSQPLTLRSPDGLTIMVGKNSRQSEEVTFRRASPDDLWLHARGVPGAHVIIRSGRQKVPEATLHQAAGLAAYYSQAREATRVAVDYTRKRHVRRVKGARPGLVTYDHEQTIHVTPLGPE